MKKHIGYLIPLGIALGLWTLNDVFVRMFVVKYLSMQEYLSFFKILAALTPIAFSATYIIKYLQPKRMYSILWFIFLFVGAYLFPVLMGKDSLIYSIWSLIYIYSVVFAATMVYMGYDWFRQVERRKELEKQNVQSELALLKNQINPHFLFNTLNNIDSLIKSNPDKASSSLLELSEIMRYMIYETKEEVIPLKQELAHIEIFMNLQKMQFANPDLVDMRIEGDIADITVPPMLFIPFVENAFKHCTDKEQKNAIRFSFKVTDKKIVFRSINMVDKARLISKDKSRGIGLDIVKRRLELLYPNRYVLQIEENNNLFSVLLKLNLKV